MITSPPLPEVQQQARHRRDTRDSWSGGMPQDLVGFANDAGGNYFCYPRRRHRAPPDDAPVWFFDHESVEAYELSPSLAAWLAWYLDNLRPCK
jgi:hypothetical protein